MKLIVMLMIAMLLIAPALLSAQPQPTPPQDKCALEGTVVNLVTGELVRKARLTLSMVDTLSSSPPAVVSTDAQGRFSFVDLEPGAYRLSASHDNYSNQQYGVKKSGQPAEPILLAPGAKKTDVELGLTPYSTIAGRIRDEDGDPMQQVPVAVMSYEYTNSGRQLTERSTATSNDLGEYRIFNLPPGKYYLRAGGIADSFIAVYYPNSPDPSAVSPLELAPGRQLTSVDFTLHRIDKLEPHLAAPTDTAGDTNADLEIAVSANPGQIDGKVENDKSEPVDHALVTLVPPGVRRNRTFFKSVRTTPDGHFTITGVAPATYKLFAWDDVEVNAVLYDPDFLRPFETAGQSIQVFEGARQSANLKLIVKPPE